MGLCLLSWLEHERTIRPSFIISAYLFFSILLDLALARTLWMGVGRHAISIIFTTTVALRTAMLLLETIDKRKILLSHYKGCAKEATSSPLSRTIFFWLTSLFFKGYKKILKLEDLDPLNADLKSETLHKALADAWDKGISASCPSTPVIHKLKTLVVPDKAAPGVLFRTWLRVFLVPLMAAVIPRLCLVGFLYAQPLLINAAVKLAGLPQMQPFNNVGYGLIGAYVIVYTGVAVSDLILLGDKSMLTAGRCPRASMNGESTALPP